MRNFPVTLFAAVMLSACQSERETSVSAPAEQAPTAGSAPAPDEATRIADELHRHIPALASDEFMERQPGTRGEELTVSYLVGEFKTLCLTPGNAGEWFQEVPITTVRPAPGA